AFANGIFAVFSAAPGTVAVDSDGGAVSVGGLQFASDGYNIIGDAIGLGTGATIIRVGDGTSAGALFKATVASELTGGAGLDKTDLGTLILTGTNSYTGNTTVSFGTLQLGDGGTSGSIVGDVDVNGVLAFDRSDSLTFAGAISGGGAVNQIGGGILTLAGDNTYTGATNVNAGTLLINGNQSAATGDTRVAGGATLGGVGTMGGNVDVADGGI